MLICELEFQELEILTTTWLTAEMRPAEAK